MNLDAGLRSKSPPYSSPRRTGRGCPQGQVRVRIIGRMARTGRVRRAPHDLPTGRSLLLVNRLALFHMFSNMICVSSLTPCFSWVFGNHNDQNRFNGFLHSAETVETVRAFTRPPITQLKPGVNETAVERRRKRCEISRLEGRSEDSRKAA